MYTNNIIDLKAYKAAKLAIATYNPDDYIPSKEEQKMIDDHYEIQDTLRAWRDYQNNMNKIVLLRPLF